MGFCVQQSLYYLHNISNVFLLVSLNQQLLHAVHDSVVFSHAVLVMEQWRSNRAQWISAVLEAVEVSTGNDAHTVNA